MFNYEFYRRKCNENDKVENGLLYFKKSDRKKQSAESIVWKLCVKTYEDKDKILKSCHEGETGNDINLGPIDLH